MEPISPTSGAKYLWDDLKRRTRQPSRHFTFWGVFLISVLFIGGVGVWLEFIFLEKSHWHDPTNLKSALATFFPALIGSTCIQFLLQSVLKQLKILSLGFMCFSFLLGTWLIVDRDLSGWIAFPVGGGGTLMSLWYWWIANADNPDFYDELPPTSPTGGENIARPLNGSLSGFSS